jgi:hypothetical protein
MNYLHILVTFLIVLFVYIHIQFQLSHSSEREVYVLDVPVTIPIEEIFELKQPVIMYLHDQSLIGELTKTVLTEQFPKFDMSVYDNTRDLTHAHILSSSSATTELFNDDKEGRYYTERNHGFTNTIPPNSIFKGIVYKHQLLEPPLCSRKMHDIMFGSSNSMTSTQYSIMYRNIFTVTKGNLHVKMMHPDIAEEHKISVKPNYTDMSFFADGKIDLWGGKYDETIELVVKEGETISIPPYWLYSFRYEDETFVTCSQFNSYMTEIATVQHTCLYWITKFTRPGRAVPISKKAQPITKDIEDNTEDTKPIETKEHNNEDENENENENKNENETLNEEQNKPNEPVQTIKLQQSDDIMSGVSVPEPDIDLTVNQQTENKNATAI